MTPTSGRRPKLSGAFDALRWTQIGWLVCILTATVAFWKFRIIDTAKASTPGYLFSTADLFAAHYPMMNWGFERLFSGDFPHWNPHQLAGLPFQAITYVGLLYPGNLIYGMMGTGAATEVSCIAHLFFAGACCFALGRTFNFSSGASLVMAFTFTWSGWMMDYINQPSLISGMCWLPATILMVELSLRGRHLATIGLMLAVTFQIFNGASEFFIHNMYVAGGYTLLRLGQLAKERGWRVAFFQGLQLLGSVSCGVLLAIPQLLPSIELLGESVRGGMDLTLAQARLGAVTPNLFATMALMTTGFGSVGVLPLAGVFLGVTTQHRGLWLFALVLIALSALLVFGGEVFRLYYETTPFGGMFRRPNKFLHIYSFGQTLMAGLAVSALEDWRTEQRRRILLHPIFLVCMTVLGGGAIYLFQTGRQPFALTAMLVGLLFFATVKSTRIRSITIVVLLFLQSVNLFFSVKEQHIRPAVGFEVFHEFDSVFDKLAEFSRTMDRPRVFLTSAFLTSPNLMQKTGMLHDFYTIGDYEPFASQRFKTFFEAVTPPLSGSRNLFHGRTTLRSDSDFNLLDLTGTRFYLVSPFTPLGQYLLSAGKINGGGFKIRNAGIPRIIERTTALPRAYFVPRAILAADPASALAALQREGFAPRQEVVLEGAPASMADFGGGTASDVEVEFVEDGAEKVVVTVRTPISGFLVLLDSYHADWEARSGQELLPVYRANYLFRAVPVGAGETRVEFTYRPRAFHTGLMISGATILVLIGIGAYRRRKKSRS